METKINLRMLRDWLKEGGGEPTKCELLLEALLNGEYGVEEVRNDIIEKDSK